MNNNIIPKMRLIVQIVGREGLVHNWMSEYIEGVDYDPILCDYMKNNKYMLSALMDDVSLLSVILNYDDGELEKKTYNKEEFETKFNVNDIFDK